MDEISYSGGSNPRKRAISKRATLFGLVALVILALFAGIIFFVTRQGSGTQVSKTITLPPTSAPSAESSPTPEVSGTPSTSPSKTPTKSSAKSDISVAVQNGSGEAGVASKGASALKAAGYAISTTGNADNFDYVGVTIQVKASEKSILAGLKSDLTAAGYTVSSATSDLSEGQSYDALVIIGK